VPDVDVEDLRHALNPRAASHFLIHLFAAVDDGWISIHAYDPVADRRYNDWVRACEIAERAVEVIEQYAGMNIYVGVATRRENLGPFLRGGIADCELLTALALDVDVDHPVHKNPNLPATFEEARALIGRFLLAPTFVVNTGFGLQPYWVLAEPLRAEEAIPLLGRWNATWQRIFGDRHLDNISNLDRITRLVGGVNQNDLTWEGDQVSGEPQPVSIEIADWGRLYQAGDFDDVLDPVPEQESPTTHQARTERSRERHERSEDWPERDWFNEHYAFEDVFRGAGWTLRRTRKRQEGEEATWARPDQPKGDSATVHADGHVAVWSSSAGIPTSLGDHKVYPDPWGLHVYLNYNGDFRAACKALRAEHPEIRLGWEKIADWVERTMSARHQGAGEGEEAEDVGGVDDGEGGTGATDRPRGAEAGEEGRGQEAREGTGADRQGIPVLPEEFWTAHPLLEHIRQAAYHRQVAPAAVLLSCLARVAAMLPPSLVLPPVIGGKVPLCLLTAIVSKTGIGKSGASKVATDLLPWNPHLPGAVPLDNLPIGSGEGLYEVMYETVEEQRPTGKPRHVHRQMYTNAYFYVDEVAVLNAIAKRADSTLLGNIRSLITGGVVGNTNASPDRRRHIEFGRYSYGLVVGIQAALAGPLLSDTEISAGTPTRTLWTPAIDPTIPDDEHAPDWPGTLRWEPPGPEQLIPLAEMAFDDDVEWPDEAKATAKFHIVPVAEAIRKEIRSNHLPRVRGDVEVDELRSQRLLIQEKVATLLCLLCGDAIETSEGWWKLARMIMEEINDRTLNWVQSELADEAMQKRRKESAHYAAREVNAEAAKQRWRVNECAKKIWAKVKDSAPGTTTRKKVFDSLRNYRLVLEDGLNQAKEEDWVREKNEATQTGSDRRVLYLGDKQP
jgi:hypothetical protein